MLRKKSLRLDFSNNPVQQCFQIENCSEGHLSTSQLFVYFISERFPLFLSLYIQRAHSTGMLYEEKRVDKKLQVLH